MIVRSLGHRPDRNATGTACPSAESRCVTTREEGRNTRGDPSSIRASRQGEMSDVVPGPARRGFMIGAVLVLAAVATWAAIRVSSERTTGAVRDRDLS